MISSNEIFTFIHFNDVYEVESAEKLDICGGAARFASVVKNYEHLQPTVLFGGDCFSPSLLSNFTKGKHMVDVLNELKVDCAVVGNHDFDFGVDELEELCDQCKFPWLLSNVYDRDTEQPLSNAKITHVIERNGRKFGLIGLVEEEWLATLPTIDVDDVDFLDFVEEGKRLAKKLKNEGCDFIIALTHMRWPNNVRLAECVEDVDLILAGHDHFYRCEKINGKIVVVSGCEFRQLTRLTVTFSTKGAQVEAEQVDITSDVVPDISMINVIEGYSALVNKQLEVVLGRLKTSMDGRFSSIRSRETNLGNFICDIVYSAVNTDVVMINSGTFRADRIHEAGPFKHRDLQQILPYLDPMVLIEVTGKQLLAALENSVSQCPKMEGRFAQVAGVRFAFDTTQPAYQRIVVSSVVIGCEKLKLDQTYRLCTKYYLAQGNDGYTVFKDCPVIIDVDNAPILNTMVQNYFVGVQVAQGLKRRKSVHRQSIITLRPFLHVEEEQGDERSRSGSHSGRRSSLLKKRSSTVEELEQFGVLSPIVDGRMTNVQNEDIMAALKIKAEAEIF